MKIYLDYAAATPICWSAFITELKFNCFNFANPSSGHQLGAKAKKVMENSRHTIANILNCSPSEIIFCSSGTESINLALTGFFLANQGRGKHIITSVIEHPAVLRTLEYLESQGAEVTYLPVNSSGALDLDELKKALRSDTIMASLMLANNETGRIQPINDVIKVVKNFNINCALHIDACQAGAWLKIDTKELGADLISLDSTKVYGPKGASLLYVKVGTVISPIIFGGGQENNLRSGTPNTGAVAGFATALKVVEKKRQFAFNKAIKQKQWLISQLEKIPKITNNCQTESSLPHIINFSIAGPLANDTVKWFSQKGICVSAGAACGAAKNQPSAVILAQTGSLDLATTAIRLSLGRSTSTRQLSRFIKCLKKYLFN